MMYPQEFFMNMIQPGSFIHLFQAIQIAYIRVLLNIIS